MTMESSLRRSGWGMAVATVASRVTGFVRVLVLAAALGFGGRLLDAYTVANTLPNSVYEVVAGGAMASIVVPLLSRAALRDRDGGVEYAQRLLSLLAYCLGAVTVLATLLAGPLVAAVTPGFTPAQQHLTVVFGRYFLPQILFYGMSAAAGAVLAVRRRFAAPTWAPLVNNVVVIVVGAGYLAVGGATRIGEVAPADLLLLAAGTTAGVVAQAAIVLWALARSGFPLRPRLDPRGVGVRRVLRFGAWALLSVLAAQVLFTVAARSATTGGAGAVSVFQYGYTVFQMPFAVVALSLLTAVLPRLSGHAARCDHPSLVADLSRSLRLVTVVLAPVAAAMIVLGGPLARLLFAHGHGGAPVALLGVELAAFGVALLPFAAYMTLLRGLYALQDARTTALISTAVCGTGVTGVAAVTWLLPRHELVVGLAASYALAYSVGAVAAAAVLRRRLGQIDGHRLTRTHLQVAGAGLVAAGTAAVAARLATAGAGTSPLGTLVTLLAGGLTGLAGYALAARALRVFELRQVLDAVRPVLRAH